MGKGQKLYRKAKLLIPGGTQLLSKRPEMFLPDLWPAYYEKAKGCNIWDLDGNKYIDMSYMGIGSCLLGYSDSGVNKAVNIAIKKGSMSTLNSPEEISLAELLIELHPWADMVRYSRSGGEAMSIAVRIARAYSKKDMVLFCGYHGWHDWYLSANLSNNKSLDGHLLPGLNPLGVPRDLRGLTIPFEFNDTIGFKRLINKYRDRIGAIVMEPIRNFEPEENFIKCILKEKKNIPLIIDEITAGFRLNCGGAHLLYGYKPDIAIFAKGMSNGYPMSAVIGKKKIMQSAQDSFISSTYWTERIGPVAAIATIKKFREKNVHEHLITTGKSVKEIWDKYASKYHIKISISGIDPLGHFGFDYEKPLVLKTLFTQFMLEEKILATNAFYSSYAHKENQLKVYSKAVNEVFLKIANAVNTGKPEKLLKGPVCHSGFKRLN